VRIGIVGTGNMGRALGLRWAEAGHEICFGSRRRERAEAAAASDPRTCTAGTLAEAARFGSVALWTVPDRSVAEVIGDPVPLADSVVIDLTNGPPPPGGGSRAEELQRGLPGAWVVKAFNTCSFESLALTADEARAAGAQTLLAGNDHAAVEVTAGLAADIGLSPIRCGALESAADLEAVARVLIGQILERQAFLLHLSLTSLTPPADPGRLGARAEPE
jgi:predicted dinucleotide-binding enzyme